MKKMLFNLVLLLSASLLGAQEFNFTVRVNTLKLQTADPRVFQTLESSAAEFYNNNKWTEDDFDLNERINANLLITIQEELSPTTFKADIAVQASRPVYGSDYSTTLINFIDKDVIFFYEQFQPIIFSQNVFNDNLSSVMAFYAYIILGLDYDSFSAFGGEPFFQIAQDIVNTVPQGAAASSPGWRSLDGNRNRFWLIENILSPRVRPLRQAWYDYHRHGLDKAATDVALARAVMVDALEQVRNVHQVYPNTMIVQMFSDSKSNEILEIFKRGTPQEQNTVIQVMTRIDPSKASNYRDIK
jgi:hypothetical protein